MSAEKEIAPFCMVISKHVPQLELILGTDHQEPQAENNGALLTVIARLLLHGSYRAIFMSQKKLLQLSHLVSQQGHFILEARRETQQHSTEQVTLEQSLCQTNKTFRHVRYRWTNYKNKINFEKKKKLKLGCFQTEFFYYFFFKDLYVHYKIEIYETFFLIFKNNIGL